MAGPPSVEIQLKRTRFQLIFCILLIVLAVVEMAAVGMSCHRCAGTGWASLTLALLAAFSLSSWYFHPQGILAWNGKAWCLHQGEIQTDIPNVQWALDFQSRLLIKTSDIRGKTHWIWLESANLNPRWLALRRALVFSSKSPALRPGFHDHA